MLSGARGLVDLAVTVIQAEAQGEAKIWHNLVENVLIYKSFDFEGEMGWIK